MASKEARQEAIKQASRLSRMGPVTYRRVKDYNPSEERGTLFSNQRLIKEFHDIYEVDKEERKQISIDLIREEFNEVEEELYFFGDTYDSHNTPPYLVNRKNLAKELADLLYVCYGTAEAYDIDLDKAVKLVHESNLSKLDENGRPVRREDGKVLKGPNYKAPDMSGALIND